MPLRHHEELNYLFSPYAYIGWSIGYLGVCFLLNNIMSMTGANLDGPKLKVVMQLYNLTQVVVCTYMVYLFLPEFSQLDIFGVGNGYSSVSEFGLMIHYFSKVLDFCDSIFMILRRKQRQLSFLHIYHHSTIIMCWGIVLNSGFGGGTAAWGAMANSFIHMVMYSHYLVTSFGIKNPYKKYITKLQLVQFALCLTHSIVVLTLSPTFPWNVAIIQFFYQCSMLILFSRFYKSSYKKKKTAGKKLE